MVRRYSSRRHPRLGLAFLGEQLRGALSYDRIAGYFTSSLLEIVGEELESVQGQIRVVCNATLDPRDVATAQAAKLSIRRAWTSSRPELDLEQPDAEILQERYARLFRLLRDGKLQIRVLPDHVFGLLHGKAGVITLANGHKTSFLGSANETRLAWEKNYELIWEDDSPEAVAWVEEEFHALWESPFACPLSELVVEDIERLSKRRVLYQFSKWQVREPAPAIIETPVYRRENGLWEHQKYFIKVAYEAHHGPYQMARLILADQVGLGKTLQLALTAMLIALTGDKPILVLAPKTLIWQWQDEMRDLLDLPSAVWNGQQWVDENGLVYPANGAVAVRKCPRRIGILSSGLITRGSEVRDHLLNLEYDCIILDEAHRARRRNIHRPEERAEPNNLLRFMWEIALRTRSLLLATATPIQLHPIEAWDLLDVLARGNEVILGNPYSPWRNAAAALALITGEMTIKDDLAELWEWIRNPMPPKNEAPDFEVLRRSLNIPDEEAVVAGDAIAKLKSSDKARIRRNFDKFIKHHNPLIRHLIRRTREQLETQYDPETNEPLLNPIKVQLFGEAPQDAIPLPAYLYQAYRLAEEFCEKFGQRNRGTGFLETILLRRMGSSMFAGQRTIERILGEPSDEEDFEEEDSEDGIPATPSKLSERINAEERAILQSLLENLQKNKERDPKYERVKAFLIERSWLEERGCIIFSQYRDSIQWLAELLAQDLPHEPIGIYSGKQSSGLMQYGEWIPKHREELKKLVALGKIRLMLGTDAASEGINLQRLGSLINLDLPWNPTRLEQRKGRIQRIGQIYDTIYVCNLRYKDSVEDRVHELLSERLSNIYTVFGQIPDILEDAWVAVARGEKEEAKRIIENIPKHHPFELKYTQVEKVNWESCTEVLYHELQREKLMEGW